MFRQLPDSMDKGVVARIDARLEDIRQNQHVSIPLAVESGSRAWGFPSPDSDYDCRFIYMQRESEYLSLWPRRDVIETPLDDVLDVNGWDLSKALKLLLKGNATVIEWLTSPISYRTDPLFRDEFLVLARRVTDRSLIGRHYLHLGERQRRTYFGDGKAVAQKKIFYALRPAAALRWLRYHPEDAVPPMHFPTLLAECDPPHDLKDIVAELLARKASTRELGKESLPKLIGQFIDAEFQHARSSYEATNPAFPRYSRDRCNDFFISMLKRGG